MGVDLMRYGSMQLAENQNYFRTLQVLLDYGLDPDLIAQAQERACLVTSTMIGNDTAKQRKQHGLRRRN